MVEAKKEKLTDWLMRGWDTYNLWSSPTANQFLYHKEREKKIREKSRLPLEDKRGGDENTLTDMSLTVMMTICHQLLTHLNALQRHRRGHTYTSIDPAAGESGVKKNNIHFSSFPEISKVRSVTPPSSGPCLCFYISIRCSPEPAAMREAPGPWQKSR